MSATTARKVSTMITTFDGTHNVAMITAHGTTYATRVEVAANGESYTVLSTNDYTVDLPVWQLLTGVWFTQFEDALYCAQSAVSAH